MDEPNGEHWLGTWSAAPQLTQASDLPPAPLAYATLRQVVKVTVAARELRVRLSNQYGTAPLEIREASIADSLGRGALEPASLRALTFNGQPSLVLGAGETRLSDPLAYPLAAETRLALTLAFGEVPSTVTGHAGSRTTSFLVAGNHARAPHLPGALAVEHWYVIAGIDVRRAAADRAIVTLGDSLTDGRGSTTDGDDRWPDALSRRLRPEPASANVAVLNHGIGGNAVLAGGLGPCLLERFERDALEACGARWLIVLEGINDLGMSADPSPVAERLIEAYRGLVQAAHARQLLVYGVPILPMGGSHYFTPEREAARATVNDWIRKSSSFDAIIDLERAVCDEREPSRLAPEFDSGDQLHLSPAGYQRMADAIELGLFV